MPDVRRGASSYFPILIALIGVTACGGGGRSPTDGGGDGPSADGPRADGGAPDGGTGGAGGGTGGTPGGGTGGAPGGGSGGIPGGGTGGTPGGGTGGAPGGGSGGMPGGGTGGAGGGTGGAPGGGTGGTPGGGSGGMPGGGSGGMPGGGTGGTPGGGTGGTPGGGTGGTPGGGTGGTPGSGTGGTPGGGTGGTPGGGTGGTPGSGTGGTPGGTGGTPGGGTGGAGDDGSGGSGGWTSGTDGMNNSAELSGATFGGGCGASEPVRRKVVPLTVVAGGHPDLAVAGEAYLLAAPGSLYATLLVPVRNAGSGLLCRVRTTAGYAWRNSEGTALGASNGASVLGSIGQSSCNNNNSCLAPGETGLLINGDGDNQRDFFPLVAGVSLALTGDTTGGQPPAPWILPPERVAPESYSVNGSTLQVTFRSVGAENPQIATPAGTYVLLDPSGLPVGVGSLNENISPGSRWLDANESGTAEDAPFNVTGCGARIRVFLSFWTIGCL